MEKIIDDALQKGFTSAELNSFIGAGKTLASKAVLSMLIALVNEGPSRGCGPSTRLAKKIKQRMPCSYSGYASIKFDETPHVLNVSLSLVDKDYRTQIEVPSDKYARDLFAQYNFLKGVAVAYYKQFSEEQPALMAKIAAYLPDVDFSELRIDSANPTTMYIDPFASKRVGIFCYYTLNGQPLYKHVDISTASRGGNGTA